MNPFLKEKIFNFISALAYLFFVGLSVYFMTRKGVSLSHIGLSDVCMIILATCRLARMIVYEKVFGLIRYLISLYLKFPVVRSLNNLITCPWCTGVWVALIIVDIYYLIPFGNYLIIFLAVSAVASPLILLSNYLNMRNDILKKQKDQ